MRPVDIASTRAMDFPIFDVNETADDDVDVDDEVRPVMPVDGVMVRSAVARLEL